jgi:HD superfamily phosphohydrolase
MGDMDVFGDPVHGAFQLSGIALQLSRTRQVQRLKRLKQLGLTCLVPRYSFATHTRWQHSLGVAHLAGVVGSSIAAAQPHLDVRSEDVEDLQLAGLFHDTGHGPFSHMFEQKIMPALGLPHWEHEAMSLQLPR